MFEKFKHFENKMIILTILKKYKYFRSDLFDWWWTTSFQGRHISSAIQSMTSPGRFSVLISRAMGFLFYKRIFHSCMLDISYLHCIIVYNWHTYWHHLYVLIACLNMTKRYVITIIICMCLSRGESQDSINRSMAPYVFSLSVTRN